MASRGGRAKRTHDWFPLVKMSGLLVSEPVLETFFPEGPDRIDDYMRRRLVKQWDIFLLRHERGDPNAFGMWLNFVLEEVLGIEAGAWKKHNEVPDEYVVSLTEYMQDLRPNRMVIDNNGEVKLLVWTVTSGKGLDRRETETGKWRATPHTKLERLLRVTRVPFGILTDGREFRLVYAPPGLTTAHITWTVESWLDEKVTLDAFNTLLSRERLLGDDEVRGLLTLAQESQRRQIDVADQLGDQVRSAIDVFIRAVDRSQDASGGELLVDIGEGLYEMSLTVMMRLIFLLYAEENNLLPHGEMVYDQAYGVTHLMFELGRERRIDPGLHQQNRDAWDRLLATFRLIHDGCTHPDLNLKALGGRLFDPKRYPALENKKLVITNDVVHDMVRYLSTAEAKLGKGKVLQQVSFRTLDVEQIGNVYEGLIDYTVIQAKEPMVVFRGKGQAIRPLSELEGKHGAALVNYLTEHAGMSKAKVTKMLKQLEEENALQAESDATSEEGEEERTVESSLLARIRPFKDVLVSGEGAVIPADQLFVAKEGNLRKGMGSYYTPRWVTSFIAERVLEPLVYDDPEGARVPKKPEDILAIKVCDPAMGSGAFLVQACRFLSEVLVESWERQISNRKEGALLTMPYGRYTQSKYDETLMPIEDREEMLVWARRFVAEHCLYGVDINQLAVDIARMSLWLATFAKDKPFSFLDHHLKCGNSVIGAWTDKAVQYPDVAWERKNVDKSLKPVLNAIKKKVKVQSKHHKLGDHFLGEEMKHLEHARKRAIATLIDMDRCSLIDVKCREEKYRTYEENPEVQGTWRLFDTWCALWFWPVEPSTSPEAVPLMDRYDELRSYLFRSREDLEQDPNIPHYAVKWWDTVVDLKRREHFFHWELEFPDVFSGDNPGFDAVIGNPPYVRQELLKQYKDFFGSTFAVSKGTTDLFAYFYERAFQICKLDARFSFISSSTYLKTAGAESLRSFLKEKTRLIEFVEFGDMPVFQGVTTYPAVAFIEKGEPSTGHNTLASDIKRVQEERGLSIIDRAGNWLAKMSIKDVFLDTAIPVKQSILDNEGGWRFEDSGIAALRKKINDAGVPLKKYSGVKIYRGVLTGLNRAFVIDLETRDRLIAEDSRCAELLKPFLEGKDLKPWQVESRNRWLICIPTGLTNEHGGGFESEDAAWEWFSNRLPAIAKWLSAFADAARRRGDKGDYFWELRPCDYYNEFEKPKIIYRDISATPCFSIDNEKYYFNNTIYFLSCSDYYLLGLLNSSILWFYFTGLSTSIQGGYYRIFSQYIKSLPIKRPEGQIADRIRSLSRELSLHPLHNNRQLEFELNTLVYDLYGLTEEEREIVEREVARGRKK